MNDKNFDKWLIDFRGSHALQTQAVRREAENEFTRKKATKLGEPKDYDKRLKVQADKTAKLRALRLAKEADDRAVALALEAAPRARRRTASAK
jgi:hypothetical protein